MKIVHLSDYYKSTLGYQMYYLCKYHQRAGHEVSIVTSDRYFPFDNYEELFEELVGDRLIGVGTFVEKGIKVHRLPIFFEIKTVLLLNGLYKTLDELKPDLVFMHNMFGITPMMVALFKKRLGYKLVYDTHVAEFNSDFKSSFVRRLYYSIFIKKISAPYIRENADKILAVGEMERDFASKSFGISEDDIPILRLGVDTQKFKSVETSVRSSLRKEVGLAAEDKVLLYTGKVQPEKEVDMLIKLTAELKKKKIRAKLLIVGNASRELRNKLDGLTSKLGVKNEVVWVGMVPHDELPKYYKISDIAIWPGNPSMARFEAMSAGLPVVLIKGFKSLRALESEDVIVTFERGNFQDLIGNVEGLLKDDKRQKELSKAGRKLVKEKFSWRKLAKEAIEL